LLIIRNQKYGNHNKRICKNQQKERNFWKLLFKIANLIITLSKPQNIISYINLDYSLSNFASFGFSINFEIQIAKL